MRFKRHLFLACCAMILLGTPIAVMIHSQWRSRQPPVVVKNGIVLCRMKQCDFQFPLPSGATEVTVGTVRVGPDTITGSIVVKNSDGTPYDAVLASHGFQFKIGSPMATSAEQPGGWVWPTGGGRIDFSYFGDR